MRRSNRIDIHSYETVAYIIESSLDEWLFDPVDPSLIGHRYWAIRECSQRIVDVLREGGTL